MFEEILDRISTTNAENVYLYLIVRKLKPDTKSNSRVTEKYDFDLRQIDIDDEIRNHLRKLTIEILERNIKRSHDVHEYSPISDSSQRVFTYSMENNAISFSSVVAKKKSGTVDTVHDFAEIVKNENLWAYCVGFYNPSTDEWTYTYKKVKSGQAVVDEENPGQNNFLGRLRTRFNSSNDKLEVLKGETFILEKNIDCFFYEDKFLVLSKSGFEDIVNLSVEHEKQARHCVEEIKALGIIQGIEKLEEMFDGNTGLHKKLVKLQSLGHYKTVDWAKVADVIEDLELNIKVDGNKLVISDPREVDLAIKLLCEYFKEGRISGKTYGTFAGSILSSGN